MESVKPDDVWTKHLAFFMTGVRPSQIPDTDSLVTAILSAVSHKEVKLLAMIRGLPAGFFYAYTAIAWVWLTLLLINGTGDLIAGAF